MNKRSYSWLWLSLTTFLLAWAVGTWLPHRSAANDKNAPKTPEPSPSVVGDRELVACAAGFVDVRSGIRNLSPFQQGRVAEVLVKEGDRIKKGDILVRLDRRYEESRLEQARADLRGAELELENARLGTQKLAINESKQLSAIEAARSAVTAAKTALAKAERMMKKDLVSPEEIEGVRAKVREAEAMVIVQEKSLEELRLMDPQLAVRGAEARVRAKQAQLQQAEKALQDCDLASPIVGTVLRVYASEGDILTAQARQPAVIVLPDEPVIVRAEVDQERANEVKVGDVVDVEDAARPEFHWEGVIESISAAFLQRRPSPTEGIQINTNDNRYLECVINFRDPSKAPRPGQKVRVRISRPRQVGR